ncbi:MAG TPA: hypothetical protein VK459_14365 [Polyangiaceae bacterium]|jgi:hypothetical protein|nr:hypothetical protein [Polyangiaceae bacterium]
MNKLQRHAPLDTTPYPPPPIGDRSGPVLTQGAIFGMIRMVAADECSPEALDAIAAIDGGAWYHGQLLETILSELEDRDPSLPLQVGRNIYFMFRAQLEQVGFASPEDVFTRMETFWKTVARGDGGEMRGRLLGPGRAELVMEQPWNCLFEEGGLRGVLEAFGAKNLRIEHRPCMRDGAPRCVLTAAWDQGDAGA